MFAYIVRRVLYAVPILVGVNLLTFALFFIVNTPDDMARMQLGAKRVTPEAIEKWKAERGYDLPSGLELEGRILFRYDHANHILPEVREAVRLRLRLLRGQARHRRRDPRAHVAQPGAGRARVPGRPRGQHFLCPVDGVLPRHLPGLLGRGAVRGDDVGLDAVLHHRRAVPRLQDLAPGADFRLRGRLRRLPLPGPAGGDRGRQRHRLEQPLVSHAVPGGDGPGLRAHARAPRACPRAWCCSATC